jgi:hypothetical protein
MKKLQKIKGELFEPLRQDESKQLFGGAGGAETCRNGDYTWTSKKGETAHSDGCDSPDAQN